MFNEFKLNDKVTLRNKLVMAPMTTCASNDDLTVADDEADYYKVRAKDLGMVITGCTFSSLMVRVLKMNFMQVMINLFLH